MRMKPPEKKAVEIIKNSPKINTNEDFFPHSIENHTSLCERFIIQMYICWQWFDAHEMAFVRSFLFTFRNVNTRQSDFDEYRAKKTLSNKSEPSFSLNI